MTTVNTAALAAHLRAMFGPQGLHDANIAEKWLAAQLGGDRWAEGLRGNHNDPAGLLWGLLRELRAADICRRETERLTAARTLAAMSRSHAAAHAARAVKVETIVVTPPHPRLGEGELALRRKAVANAKAAAEAAAKAAFAARVGSYRAKRGQCAA